MSEFQLVLVVSWVDLFSRVVFSVGLIGCMEGVKDLLRQSPRTTHVTTINPCAIPIPTQPAKLNGRTVSRLGSDIHRVKQTLPRLTNVLFALWGLVVLILHVHSESRGHLAQCLVQLRAWATQQPTLLVMDCRHEGIQGLDREITPHWEGIDAASVTHLLLLHCPQLHIPSRIQNFSHLFNIKIYNSTIIEWDNMAALTNSRHPHVSGFIAIRVNLTNAQLPPGLMSSEFPHRLRNIEFVATNLASLPDTFDLSWPVGLALGFEACQFAQLPPVWRRLAPSQLSFAGNLFTTFPFEAISIPGLLYLNLDSNPIATLESRAISQRRRRLCP